MDTGVRAFVTMHPQRGNAHAFDHTPDTHKPSTSTCFRHPHALRTLVRVFNAHVHVCGFNPCTRSSTRVRGAFKGSTYAHPRLQHTRVLGSTCAHSVWGFNACTFAFKARASAFHAHAFAFDMLFNACANILDILIVVVHINRFVPSLFIFANIRVWFKIRKNLERTTY